MKTVTSEDNLTRYVIGEKGIEVIDPSALNRKIKSIKAALKLSEHHNKDLEHHNRELHMEIKTLKDTHKMTHLENECRKHKQLYEMLTENYEAKCLELKETKRRLKRIENEQMQTAGVQISLEEAEQTTRQYREAILKQERQLGRLREENKLLYDQLYEKNSRLKDLEPLIVKNYSSKSEKDKVFLANLRTALEGKNQQFEKLLLQKNQLSSSRSALQKENGDLGIKMTRLAAELEFEKRLTNEAKEKFAKQEKECARLSEELKIVSVKYTELLGFSYELQKDFERDLQTALKEIGRKDKQ